MAKLFLEKSSHAIQLNKTSTKFAHTTNGDYDMISETIDDLVMDVMIPIGDATECSEEIEADDCVSPAPDLSILPTESDWSEEDVEFLDFPDSVSVEDSDTEIDCEEEPSPEGTASYPFSSLPPAVLALRAELRKSYTCPTKSDAIDLPRELTTVEMHSLRHYVTWWKTNSTVEAYNQYTLIFNGILGEPLLSLYKVRRLAEKVLDFKVKSMDMCPKSCIVYTGKNSNLKACYFSRDGTICNEARYKGKSLNSNLGEDSSQQRPRRHYYVLPVMATIRALFANEDTSNSLRYRDSSLKEALNLIAHAKERKFSDFANSDVHLSHCGQMGLFPGHRDIAFALSSDGAQLTMKRVSNTWILILIILNLPPTMRYRSNNIIMTLAIPGPNSPGDLESFVYPLFEEMAIASEGIWLWDAVDSSHFVCRAWITIILGDMLGSAKFSGLAGHTANMGDRFGLVKGAKTSNKGGKRIYYPLSPPEKDTYNKGRPNYSFYSLPLRTEDHYWKTILDLTSPSFPENRRAKLMKESGISRLPLTAACVAFRHPTFFPFDPFHLFYENCMAHIWDLWGMFNDVSAPIKIGRDKLQAFGQYLPNAMTTLPPAFCGPIRDIHLKCQSQYKIYEWMAVLHWYLVPLCLELGFDYTLLDNIAQFVWIIEYSMTIRGRTKEELQMLHSKISSFLTDFERIYVADDPARVSSCRLCIFQLIHIPSHIKWNGSVRIGSQATMERSIGELTHRIRSRKAPFANLSRLIKEKELIKLLLLYYPILLPKNTNRQKQEEGFQMISRQPPHPKKKLSGQILQQELESHLNTIRQILKLDIFQKFTFERWGKIRLNNGYALENNQVVFGEALAFYRFRYNDACREIAIYKPLIREEVILNVATRGEWSKELQVIEISRILTIVGIWRVPEDPERVYILQKHPGLEMLMEHMPDEAEAEQEVEVEVESVDVEDEANGT